VIFQYSFSNISVPGMSYEDECRRKEQKNLFQSAAAWSIRSMGYTSSTVWKAIISYFKKTGEFSTSCQQ